MRNRFKFYAAALPAAVTVGLVGVSSPSFAQNHTTVGAQASHFIESLGWMLSDPAKHAELCGPGYEYYVNSSGTGALPSGKGGDGSDGSGTSSSSSSSTSSSSSSS